MNQFASLTNHPLATQPLRDLLDMAGRPETPAQKRIFASLDRAYKRMGTMFPSEQFGDYLDALYRETFSVVDNAVFALAALAWQHGRLAIETKEPSLDGTPLQSKEKTVDAVLEAAHELDPDVAAVVKRCDELMFRALATAATRINAALRSARKKK